MDPQLYQALQATSPFASPRAAAPSHGQPSTWHPVIMDHHGNMQPTTETAQKAGSMLAQQQWMHRQMRGAMENMRRDGVYLLSACWTLAWECVPDANPSPDHPD
eukprot:1188497-Pyramimonas_sp.AAC.1